MRKPTRRFLDKDLPKQAAFRGKRVANTEYAVIEFYDRGVRVSLEGNELKKLSWNRVAILLNEWSVALDRKVRRARTPDRTALARIKDEARNLYKESGFQVRVIYRTIQAEFGDEAPHNLVPPDPKPDSLTIFLDFFDFEFSQENIRRIFAS
ncbi:MAG: hypothetical protein DWQ07_17750 [Chloroflexi bacterium]|nr:MAG: hypothetical protein DWQ07_17750 [Chloroflexota bacterium]